MNITRKNVVLAMVLCLLLFAVMFSVALAMFASNQNAGIAAAMLSVLAGCGFAINLNSYRKCRAS